MCVYSWINLWEFPIFHFVTLHLQVNRIFLKCCFWCSIKYFLCPEGEENPLSLAQKVLWPFFFSFLPKQHLKVYLLFLRASQHSDISGFVSCTFSVGKMSSPLPLGFCKTCCSAHPSRISVIKTFSGIYFSQPACSFLVVPAYCSFPPADSLAVHCG